VRLQAAIGRQVRARKTPVLQFRPDDVIRTAERIDRILRDAPPPAPGDDAGPA
jgi:ribosome-binding factor A